LSFNLDFFPSKPPFLVAHLSKFVYLENMKIVVAPASFKGSLSSTDAAKCIAEAVRKISRESTVVEFPLSDGGEGFVDVLVTGSGGEFREADVDGPLPEQSVHARWGILGDGTTGVIEMAAAAGLSLVPQERRNPKVTTTFGVGQLIRKALGSDLKRIVLGLGGSATNDGGAGMAQALGARLLRKDGSDIARGGAALIHLHQIDITWLDRRIRRTEFRVASDVTNPLCGRDGASEVYGPQKGASPSDVQLLDQALLNYATLLKRDVGADVLTMPGAGAAGGMGAGCVAFLKAQIELGVEFVLRELNFDDKAKGASLIITGEGRIDAQTTFGKAIAGVARRAKSLKIPAVAIGGSLDGDPKTLQNALGLRNLYALVSPEISRETAMKRVRELLSKKTREIIQEFKDR
jgi:glycerate kinase